jgi:2-methylisocitrate lyase-like PEP mutase family enzyme
LAADAGADVCFIEGVKTSELLKQTVTALAPKPVLVNVISGGLTPTFTYREAEEMGAKIISRRLTARRLPRNRLKWLLFSLFLGLLRCDGACRTRSYALP